jgi:ABC-2 type transport system permease protein
MTAAAPIPTTASRLPRLLALAVRRDSVSWWSLRSFLITLIIGQSVTPLLGLLVWSAALPDSPGVTGYYVMLLAVQLMTVSYEQHTLANSIYDGSFADRLVRPQPPLLEVLATNLAVRFWFGIFGLPVLVLAATTTGALPRPAAFAAALPSLLLAMALRFAFTCALALTAFWTQRAHGAVTLGETLIFLLGGVAAPLALLPGPVGELGRALPFWSMLGAPAEIASGAVSSDSLPRVLGGQTAWLAVLLAALALMWRRGVRRFTAVGG